jgi:uncharacterized protein (TIGR02001 family)
LRFDVFVQLHNERINKSIFKCDAGKHSRDRNSHFWQGGSFCRLAALNDAMKGTIMRKSLFTFAAVCAAYGSMAAAPAFAADDEAAAEEKADGPFTITGGVALVTDYRFRGVSLSDKDIAVQPTLTIKHESGLYLGVWGSNLANNPGDDIEVDLFAGFAGGDTVTYDVGATYYLYPGVSSFNYVELTGKLGTTIGPVTVGSQLSYAPSQDNLGNQDNIYIGGNASVGIPGTPVTLTSSLGYEDGAFSGGSGKLDWTLGASASFSGFTASATYVDTDRRSTFTTGDSKATVVFALSYAF